MRQILVLLVIAALASGCRSYLNNRYPPGEMGPDGRVYPCNEHRTNAQACGEARYNAPRVQRLSIGQSLEQARTVMGRDPEQRSVTTQSGQAVEVWSYLTDYDNSILSVITFANGRVASIESVRRR